MSKYSHCCTEMLNAIRDSDIQICFNAKFREFSIPINDGGSSRLSIRYCPWCSKALPKSLRDEWFDELEMRNIDPEIDTIPAEFQDETWYVIETGKLGTDPSTGDVDDPEERLTEGPGNVKPN